LFSAATELPRGGGVDQHGRRPDADDINASGEIGSDRRGALLVESPHSYYRTTGSQRAD
jgi:hypothetical protein